MDSWLKKSHDNGNKRIADDVEADFFCVLYALDTSALLLFFFHGIITTNTQLTVFFIFTVKGRGNF